MVLRAAKTEKLPNLKSALRSKPAIGDHGIKDVEFAPVDVAGARKAKDGRDGPLRLILGRLGVEKRAYDFLAVAGIQSQAKVGKKWTSDDLIGRKGMRLQREVKIKRYR